MEVVESGFTPEKTVAEASPKPRLLVLQDLQQMDWKRFEELSQRYFQKKGYNARLTGSGADGGVDVILEKTTQEGRSVKVYVQCKAWSYQRIGVKAVRELYGVMAADGVPVGVFITASDFTEDAQAFAKGKKLQLISGNRLLTLISQLPEVQQKELATDSLSGDYGTPTCPQCDIKMVLRTVSKGKNKGNQFWGCRNFPGCHQKLYLKRDEKNSSVSLTSVLGIPPKVTGDSVVINRRRVSDPSNAYDSEPMVARKTRRPKVSGKTSNGNSHKPLLISGVFVFVVMALVIKGISAVLAFLSESTNSHGAKVQQQAQQTYLEKGNRPESLFVENTNRTSEPINPPVQQLSTAYDQQVAMMEQQAVLASDQKILLEIQANREQEQARANAWKAWYQMPRGCDDWLSEEHMIECINQKMRAKREFEQLWAEGKI
ncbi:MULTISPECIES: restriction endonuclease [unclassified Endozoicomonas]|uniref:restriction endonuclease n=1 Tax=unclassified Endozoicomonas TaxID=2644528 RepID=UPI003BB6C944